MTPRHIRTAVEQWWLDKRGDLEEQLAALRGKKVDQRKIDRLKSGIERIDIMLAAKEWKGALR